MPYLLAMIPPLQTQHNEGFGGCNEDNSNDAIRRLGADHNEGKISNTSPHTQVSKRLKRGRCENLNNRSRIGSDTILKCVDWS